MRKLVFFICFVLFVNLNIYSQENDTANTIIDYIEQMPVFPGGLDSIWCFLERNFQYEILNAGNKEVKFITRFVVDTLGKTTDIKVVASIPQNIIFDHQDSLKISELVRVFELMQTWQPATQNNIKVRCLYTIPIKTPYKEFRCRQSQKRKKFNSH
jgi:protein TonB